MIVEAQLFINPDDCTELHWCNAEDEADFEDYVAKRWIYLGTFGIEAGKIMEMHCCEKSWERNAVRDEV